MDDLCRIAGMQVANGSNAVASWLRYHNGAFTCFSGCSGAVSTTGSPTGTAQGGITFPNTNEHRVYSASAFSQNVNTSWTFGAWLYLSAATAGSALAIFQCPNFSVVRSGLNSSRIVFVRHHTEAITGGAFFSDNMISATQWVHITAVNNAGTTAIYVNGESVAVVLSNSAALSPTTVCVGKFVTPLASTTDFTFPGTVHEPIVINARVLSQSEIIWLANATRPAGVLGIGDYGPEMVTNGDFSDGLTEWANSGLQSLPTSGIELVSPGVVRMIYDGTNYVDIRQTSAPLPVAGKSYIITCTNSNVSGVGELNVTTLNNGLAYGENVVKVNKCIEATKGIKRAGNGSFTALINRISVRETSPLERAYRITQNLPV